MLKLDAKQHKFEGLTPTELKSEQILERWDLQQTIVNSWDLFRNEIGLPSAFLIGKEIRPHASTQDSIDLLAYDPDDSALVVIELKRGRHKLHLIQALAYAAMVSKWTNDDLLSRIQRDLNPDPGELIELVQENEISEEIRIVLISEGYDPEVILTADWLTTAHGVNITAFAITTHRMGGDTLVGLDQRYPLRELGDAYEERRRKSARPKEIEDIEWQDILPKLKYSFAARGIELCRKIKDGQPSRRRFGAIRANYEGFSWISINFRENYVNVYMKADFAKAEDFIRSKFRNEVKIGRWRDGYSVLIPSETDFEDLVKWLKLE